MAIVRKRPRRRQYAVRKLSQYAAKTPRGKAALANAAHVVARMREGLSLNRAAAEYGIDPRTVLRLAGPALRKRSSGTYAAKSSDKLLRLLVVPTPRGLAEIAVRDSRSARRIGQYWDAIRLALETGDYSKLRGFRGETVATVDGARLALMTDPDELERLGNVGALSFESIYARTA